MRNVNSLPAYVLPMVEFLEDRRLFAAGPMPADYVVGAAPALQVSASKTTKAAVPTGLTTTYGSAGLTGLTYNGVKILDTVAHPGEGFRITTYTLLRADGTSVTHGDWEGGFTKSWDAANKRLIFTYAWGTVSCRYILEPGKLRLSIKVTNTSRTDTLQGLNILALTARFNKQPAGFAPNTPQMGFGIAPDAEAADFGSGIMMIGNDQVDKKLYTGFATTSRSVAENMFNVRIGSVPLGDDPGSWPKFTRPVAPGASDSYDVSLRFAKSGTSIQSMASDIIQAYAKAHASKVVWADGRAIANLNPTGSSPANRSATNPRGWFNDPTVDVTTTAGLTAFKARLLAYADQSIAVLKGMNAQGAITWDLEGESTMATYVGDPRAAGTLAPELEFQGAVDAYFKKFRDAGIKVGVTIRPQKLVIDSNGPVQAAHQETVTDPGQLLIDKIAYAKQRWGCSIFYIDSNDKSDVASIAKAAAANPDVLLIPENQSTETYAYGAPYDELKQGIAGTPADVRQAVQGAFSVIYVEGGDLTARKADLIDSVKKGDILLFNGWWDHPNNAVIKDIYKQAGVNAVKVTSAPAPVFTQPSPFSIAGRIIVSG